MIKPDLNLEIPAELGALHFVGIGGSGMSGIARLFLDAGHRVTGSDRSESAAVQELRAAGAEVWIGHDAAQVGSDVDALVVTGALWADNPEYQEALRRGIPVLHRAHALAFLVRGTRLIAVSGAHGKSTTTGMVVTALRELGADPSFVNGGVIAGYGRSSGHGSGDWWVIEADESDGSFELYDPAVVLVTNLDDDHLDHYGSAQAVEDAFVRVASRASELLVTSADDSGARTVAARATAPRSLTFGTAADADVRLVAERIDADAVITTIVVAGVEHDVRLPVAAAIAINATGAFAVLAGLGFEPAGIARGLEAFAGTGRRFEHHATVAGVRVYDDYAHHPTEVVAALETARSVVGAGRVIAVHQPHLYSRTQAMAGEFAEAYERLADHTVVLDVYGAREDPIPGVTGALVAERFRDASRVDYLPDWQAAADRVGEIARPGDLVMTLSCGDVYRIIPQLVAALEP
ncbi:UDP-N-acetylmuramate--L-alanine ligase [Pseudolysinimonas sp.]|uniref:UDP-N-acetylmuramate--L-alanine ligase n=1 Tax=Pseudolysinimonas sp. TaxID=2680009 RepID=UPI00286B4142|nr:UDP-N-acetylmuramate--L-alanine ligase [Pseudolysinimonas sp.]